MATDRTDTDTGADPDEWADPDLYSYDDKAADEIRPDGRPGRHRGDRFGHDQRLDVGLVDLAVAVDVAHPRLRPGDDASRAELLDRIRARVDEILDAAAKARLALEEITGE